MFKTRLKLKWRREILFCGHTVRILYLYDGIPVNSATFANEETWFQLIEAELLVEHSNSAGGFAEAAGTELCKGNVEYIADVELDCTGTYPLAM